MDDDRPAGVQHHHADLRRLVLTRRPDHRTPAAALAAPGRHRRRRRPRRRRPLHLGGRPRHPLRLPDGLLADPSIRYRVVRGGIKVIAYYVKATKGARVSSPAPGAAARASSAAAAPPVGPRQPPERPRLKNGTKITVTASLNGRLTTTVIDRVKRARRVEGRPVCKPVGC